MFIKYEYVLLRGEISKRLLDATGLVPLAVILVLISQRHSCIEVSRTKLHAVWKQMLHRLLQGIVFLEERRLAFGGESQRIGYPNNGNFLELISHHDQ